MSTPRAPDEEPARLPGHDASTGLPNEALLHELLAWELRYARRENLRVGLLYLAFDDWPALRTRAGDAAAATLLGAALEQIRKQVRDSDVIARLGEAELVLLAARLRQAADASRLANAVREALLRPLQAEGVTARLSASLGISLYPDDGEQAPVLIARARCAMAYSRQVGKGGFAFYTPECEGADG